MNNIQKYFAGREQFIELLEAVGIRTLEQFASADPSTVLPELHQAKRMLKLQTEIPSAPVFREWVNQALSSPTAPEPELLPIHEGDGLPLPLPLTLRLLILQKTEGNVGVPIRTALQNISPPRPGCRKNTATSPQNMFTPTRSRKPTFAKRHQAHDLLPDMDRSRYRPAPVHLHPLLHFGHHPCASQWRTRMAVNQPLLRPLDSGAGSLSFPGASPEMQRVQGPCLFL